MNKYKRVWNHFQNYMYCLVSKIWGDTHTKLFTSAEELEEQTNWLTSQHYEIIAIYRLMRPMTYEQYRQHEQREPHAD